MTARAGVRDPLLPTFIIAGIWKSGSTSIWHELESHPEVLTSQRKEPGFFDWHFDEGIGFYRPLFAHDEGQRARGEASVGYLVHEEAAQRMRETVPDIRLIFILRDPISRAVSHHYWRRAIGKQTSTLDEAIDQGLDAPEINPSRYGTHLARFYDAFPDDQILVALTEELRADPAVTMRRIFEHIGVDSDHPLTGAPPTNTAVAPRSDRVARMLGRTRERLRDAGAGRPGHPLSSRLDTMARAGIKANKRALEKPPVTDDQRARLVDLLAPEVEQARALLGRDLHEWPTASS